MATLQTGIERQVKSLLFLSELSIVLQQVLKS